MQETPRRKVRNTCCDEFSRIYRTICPNEWVKRWEEQMEIGTFPVDLPPTDNDCSYFSKLEKYSCRKPSE
ncbi:hypothetical protein JTB14_010306 [Gonioctena quinquepunctata]|nr:hypothetical protein JTB14_010306 [Gonioctena quinquepunctata]